jgi:serine O-acetyltransferase
MEAPGTSEHSRETEVSNPPAVRARHAGFRAAVQADARLAAAYRGERHEFRSGLDVAVQVLRLMITSDAFLGLVAYRLEARLRQLGIPGLPWLARRVALSTAQISISDAAVVAPGVFIPYGQVVIYGTVEVEPFVTLFPWVMLGPMTGAVAGPTIRARATLGTGAKVIGEVEVGAAARVGTNAVVLNDVPPNTTVVGMPAEPVAE